LPPAVLQLPDGGQRRGKLETVSLTGCLLKVPSVLDQGSRIRVFFLTQMGSVGATAEMLSPVSATQQPFRFISIGEGDHRNLRAVVQSTLNSGEQAWIQKYRAASVDRRPAKQGVFWLVPGSLILLALLTGVVWLLNLPLPR